MSIDTAVKPMLFEHTADSPLCVALITRWEYVFLATSVLNLCNYSSVDATGNGQREETKVAEYVRCPDADVPAWPYDSPAFGEEQIRIVDMLQDIVADADVNGLIWQWPGSSLYQTKFVQP